MIRVPRVEISRRHPPTCRVKMFSYHAESACCLFAEWRQKLCERLLQMLFGSCFRFFVFLHFWWHAYLPWLCTIIRLPCLLVRAPYCPFSFMRLLPNLLSCCLRFGYSVYSLCPWENQQKRQQNAQSFLFVTKFICFVEQLIQSWATRCVSS